MQILVCMKHFLYVCMNLFLKIKNTFENKQTVEENLRLVKTCLPLVTGVLLGPQEQSSAVASSGH